MSRWRGSRWRSGRWWSCCWRGCRKAPLFFSKKKTVLFKKSLPLSIPALPFLPKSLSPPSVFPLFSAFLSTSSHPFHCSCHHSLKHSIPTMLCSQTSLSQPPPWQGGAVFGHASQTWLIRKPKNLAASSSQGGKNILPRETLTKTRVYGVFK